MATITAEQIAAAKQVLTNADLAARAAQRARLPYWLMCAVVDKESEGRNVYGHDSGGALSGFPEPVDESNWRVFWWLVDVKQQRSNGVGPMQLTFPGFFTDMLAQGLKPWSADDNLLYGARLLRGYLSATPRSHSTERRIKAVGKRYNGSAAYGDDLWRVARGWFRRVGNTDRPSFKP